MEEKREEMREGKGRRGREGEENGDEKRRAEEVGGEGVVDYRMGNH